MENLYHIYQIDSFTKDRLTGNPAGVITNADGLSDQQMQKIARELNNSETAFIFKSENDTYDMQVRFFTPTKEVPICGHETYGEDPYLTAKLGSAFVRGIQGKDHKYLKAAACAKHFAVHSGPESERHSFDAVVSKKDLWETYLPAFKELVTNAKVEGVMGAYNRTNGEPCCGSKTLLKDILREEWGFKGYVTSDCWAIKDFHG